MPLLVGFATLCINLYLFHILFCNSFVLISILSDKQDTNMTRSNKKKHHQKPATSTMESSNSMMKSSTSPMESSTSISTLLSDERKMMLSRAIQSAKHHGINLKPGSPNPGLGDCAFEAVIQNNNDRNCYPEKFPLSITTYRQIWVTDMANRTVDTDWNIYSRQEWMTGWQQLMIPGTYERGIYGDLMLPGIACGVRKLLIIFNTDPQSPHDPIYVVDPRQFNVEADSNIPIMLAYNQSHYESLHPRTDADIQAATELAREYLDNRYRYGKEDFPFLLGLEDEQPNSNNYFEDDDNFQTTTKIKMKKERQIQLKMMNIVSRIRQHTTKESQKI